MLLFLFKNTVFKKKVFFQPLSKNLRKKIDFCRKKFEKCRKKGTVTHLIDPDNWTIRIIGVLINGALLY